MNMREASLRVLLCFLAALLVLTACVAAPTGEVVDDLSSTVPGDTCQSAPVLSLTSTPIKIDGQTRGRGKDYSSWCGDKTGSAPDVVVDVDLPRGGVFSAQVYATSTGFNPTMYVRTDCATDWYCADFGPTSEVFRDEMAPGVYHVIVDGADGTSGSFSLFLDVAPAVCGDGFVSPSIGEQCDVGEPIDGDGCGDPGAPNECQHEAPDPVADTPPGTPITLEPTLPTYTDKVANIFQGTTIGYTDNRTGTCSQHGAGRDRCYLWEVPPLLDGYYYWFVDEWIGFLSDGITPACTDLLSPYCWDAALYMLQQQPDGTWAEPPKRGVPTWIQYERVCKDWAGTSLDNNRRTVFPGERYAFCVDTYDVWTEGPYFLFIYLYAQYPSACPNASPCVFQ